MIKYYIFDNSEINLKILIEKLEHFYIFNLVHVARDFKLAAKFYTGGHPHCFFLIRSKQTGINYFFCLIYLLFENVQYY